MIICMVSSNQSVTKRFGAVCTLNLLWQNGYFLTPLSENHYVDRVYQKINDSKILNLKAYVHFYCYQLAYRSISSRLSDIFFSTVFDLKEEVFLYHIRFTASCLKRKSAPTKTVISLTKDF